jgi:hypothetical protein
MTRIDQLGRMEDLTEGFSTKADKMRVLDRHGYSRADIARFLEVRYQQVRNTLEGDKRTGYDPDLTPSYSNDDPASAEPGFRQLPIDDDGFANIPPDLIEDLADGRQPIYVLQVANGLFVSNTKGIEARVRSSFA